jgi:hypothetical protein
MSDTPCLVLFSSAGRVFPPVLVDPEPDAAPQWHQVCSFEILVSLSCAGFLKLLSDCPDHSKNDDCRDYEFG